VWGVRSACAIEWSFHLPERVELAASRTLVSVVEERADLADR